MSSRTVTFLCAGIFGIPVVLVPNAREIVGHSVFLGLAAFSLAGFIVGTFGHFDDPHPHRKS